MLLGRRFGGLSCLGAIQEFPPQISARNRRSGNTPPTHQPRAPGRAFRSGDAHEPGTPLCSGTPRITRHEPQSACRSVKQSHPLSAKRSTTGKREPTEKPGAECLYPPPSASIALSESVSRRRSPSTSQQPLRFQIFPGRLPRPSERRQLNLKRPRIQARLASLVILGQWRGQPPFNSVVTCVRADASMMALPQSLLRHANPSAAGPRSSGKAWAPSGHAGLDTCRRRPGAPQRSATYSASAVIVLGECNQAEIRAKPPRLGLASSSAARRLGVFCFQKTCGCATKAATMVASRKPPPTGYRDRDGPQSGTQHPRRARR